MADDMEMKSKELNFRTPNPYSQLYIALQDSDIESFEKHLKRLTSNGGFDINHVYDDPHYGTLLDIACQALNYSDFVRLLITYGANTNMVNKTRKKAPLHFAIESSDLKTLQYLLDSPNIDVNILDNTGGTVLHLACRLEKLEQVKLLLGHRKIRVNALNKKNQTPIQLALMKENKDIVIELLKHKDIDIDSIKTLSGESIRESIKDKLPDLDAHLPEPKERNADHVDKGDTISKLFSYLRQHDVDAFAKLIKDDQKLVNSDDGDHTFLQYSCEYGLYDFVSLLIRCGADINHTCATNNKTGLMLACKQGYYKIVQLLISNDSISLAPVNQETILQTVIKNSTSENASFLGATNEGRDYFKCLKVILRNAPLNKLNINQGDIKGNTVLHYAAKTGNQDIIFLLLDHGAYVGTRNIFAEPALADISPKILEAYLDQCITTNEKLAREDNYEIIFKYNFLVPPKAPTQGKSNGEAIVDVESNTNSIMPASETDPLLYMSRSSELRPLLIHPVLTSFIHLKWYSIRRFFYYNLAFYASFWLLLTVYILGFYDTNNEFAVDQVNQTNSWDFPPLKSKSEVNFLWCALVILLGMLVLRELFQLFVSPVRYVITVENWLEIFLIIVTTMILFGKPGKNSRNQISAIGILFSWGELVLLIGRHPSLSTNIEMFKTVSHTFLKFLAWYSILILAFALSFYSLFKDSTAEDNNFLDPGMSIFKTVVMLTGEFDSGSIPFVSNPGTSHVLFVLFVFLIAIVLFNLLNGLAVSDTQVIRADAELVGHVSRVKLISYIETMALGNPIPIRGFAAYLKSICCCVPDSFLACNSNRHLARIFSRKTNLFPDSIPDYEIHVLPNQENRVDLTQTGHRRKRQDLDTGYESNSCFAKCKNFMMEGSIVRAAKDILSKQLEETDQNDKFEAMQLESKKKLDEYGQRLQQLEAMTQQSQVLLNEIFTLVKKKHKKKSSSDSD